MMDPKFPSSNCSYCTLKKNIKQKTLSWNSTNVKKILIVNDFPTTSNLRQVFTPTQMRYFRQMLKEAGIKYNDIHVTNLVKCPSSSKDNRYTAIKCCQEILQKEMEGKEIIIGFGEAVLKYFTGFDSIHNRRGSIYELSTGQLFVGTTTIYSMMKAKFSSNVDRKMTIPVEIMVEDLKKARRLLKGSGWKVKENYCIRPGVRDIEEWSTLLYSSRVKDVVAVDIETTYYKGQPTICAIPITISFGFEDKSIVLNFTDHLREIVYFLRSPTPKVFQNGVFDLVVLTNCRIEVVNWTRDTMYMHHLLFSELPHSMSFLQSVYTTLPYHKDMVNFTDASEV